MAEDSGQERSEAATPKRLHDAREKGQIPRSRELNTVTMMLAAAIGLLAMGQGILRDLTGLMQHTLSIDRARIFDSQSGTTALMDAIFEALLILAPLLALFTLAAILAPLALGGWSFSPQAMGFKWDKLDPIKGFGRMFSWRGLMELAKSLAKFALLAAIAGAFLWYYADEFMGLGQESLESALAHVGSLLIWGFVILSASLIVVAGIDVPFQLWDHARQLRMTRQEVRDELKETDGRPEVKGHIRRMQREMARRRMMQEVPKADVVITNPTHYAVALRYDAGRMGAPRVVAKGADLISVQIRAVATEHRIPILSAPPLARSLYHHTELNQEIPAGLYLAVAQILAYVFQLRERGAPAGEPAFHDLPIPTELRRD